MASDVKLFDRHGGLAGKGEMARSPPAAGWWPYARMVLAVDLGTVLPFVAIHQILLAVTPAPLFSLLPALVPSIAVTLAFRSWQVGRAAQRRPPLHPFALASGLVVLGAAAMAFPLALGIDRPFVRGWAALWPPLLAAAAAAVAAAVAAWWLVRRASTAALSALAVFLAWLLPSPFLVTRPVGFVNVLALVTLSASMLTGGVALAWSARRWAEESRPASGAAA